MYNHPPTKNSTLCCQGESSTHKVCSCRSKAEIDIKITCWNIVGKGIWLADYLRRIMGGQLHQTNDACRHIGMSGGCWIWQLQKASCKKVQHTKKTKYSIIVTTVFSLLSCLLSGFLVCTCMYLSYGLVYIYSIIEECVGHSSEWGEGNSTLRSQQRESEREEFRQLVCVCQCNTESLQY